MKKINDSPAPINGVEMLDITSLCADNSMLTIVKTAFDLTPNFGYRTYTVRFGWVAHLTVIRTDPDLGIVFRHDYGAFSVYFYRNGNVYGKDICNYGSSDMQPVTASDPSLPGPEIMDVSTGGGNLS